MPHCARQVTYVGAEQAEQYALVKKDHGGGSLDLIVYEAPGWELKENVPYHERESATEDNGHTWHK